MAKQECDRAHTERNTVKATQITARLSNTHGTQHPAPCPLHPSPPPWPPGGPPGVFAPSHPLRVLLDLMPLAAAPPDYLTRPRSKEKGL